MTTIESREVRGADETLSSMPEPERNARFLNLQERMSSVWDSMKLGLDDESVVIIPSVTISRTTADG